MTKIFDREFARWQDFPADQWRWPNFSAQEMACRGDGKLMVNEEAMDKLQALRTHLGRPLNVNSAYRSPAHNRAVGGVPNSMHLKAKAFDVRMDNHDPHEFERAARNLGFRGFGYYPDSGFMHIDVGDPRSWGTPFPPRAKTPDFAPEPSDKSETGKQVGGVVVGTGAGGAITMVTQLEGTAQLVALGGLIVVVVLGIVLFRKPIGRMLFGASKDV